MNADAISDLVIGEPSSNGESGRAYVFYGVAGGIHTTPDVTLNGPGTSNAEFGWSFAAAQIRDSSSFSTDFDLVVGAPGANNGAIYFFKNSGTGIPTTATTTISGEGTGDRFGDSLSNAGKLDKTDGTLGIVVGATGGSSGGVRYGKAYIIQATSTGLNSTWSWSATGTQSGSSFGQSVLGNFDVDGGGSQVDDIAVGIPRWNHNNDSVNYYQSGAVHVYRGYSNGTFAHDEIIEAPAAEIQKSAQFGFALAGGDLNGDIISDLIVGSPYKDVTAGDAKGKVYVYLGATTWPASVTVLTASDTTTSTGGHLGKSLDFVPKTATTTAPCFVAGAPDAPDGTKTNAGIACLFQFVGP